VQRLVVLIKNELFLWQYNDDVKLQVELVLNALEQHDMVKQSKAGFWSVSDDPQFRAQLRLMGECIDETMQRFAIITSLVSRMAPIGKKPLEDNVVAIAKRLSVLNNINAPEFIDKKAQAALINVMITENYIGLDEQGLLVGLSTLDSIRSIVSNLVDIKVLQSIAR
jgi:glycerol-3-phosphate O-acyltransferase